MILTDVLTATDLNPTYYKFIPVFVSFWKKLFPSINIHIILIAEEIIDELKPFSEYIKIFKPIKNMKTAFIAQTIRILYPSLLNNSKGGILITDMDIVPMNTSYYTKNIKNYNENKFICYRPLSCVGKDEMVICYNIAHPNVWKDIFNIDNENDIIETLTSIYDKNNYSGMHGGSGWFLDQLFLYSKTQEWNNKTNSLIILDDKDTRFKRLDRNKFPNNDTLLYNTKNKLYTDYHLHRPFPNYKNIILNILKII